MKMKLYIIAILSIVTMVAEAQTYGKTYTPVQRSHEAILQQQAIQSQQIMQTGNAYKGTVYEPFGTAAPSELSEVGGTSTEGNTPEKHLRRGFDTGGDAGQGPSPIGEPWILVVMAVVFGGMVYYRRKKQQNIPDSIRDNGQNG